MIAIADTSFVVAYLNRRDLQHEACVKVFKAQRKIIIPQTALGEIAYMLARSGGALRVAHFILGLPAVTKFEVYPLGAEELKRAGEILKEYSDIDLDFVDATVAAVAEHLRISRILTLDHTDFSILRPNHIDHFELLPAQP